MNRRGFTLIELMMSLVLFGIVSVPLYAILVNQQRTYRQETQRIDLNGTVRIGAAVLPAELRELDAGDPAGSDIISMTSSGIVYKVMRNVYFMCEDADVSANELAAYRDLTFGLRGPDPQLDSVVVFGDFDPKTRFDDRWLHGSLTAASTAGAPCPDGAPSIRFTVAGIPAADLAGAQRGAPLRFFEVAELTAYPDASGDWWLSGRRYEKATAAWGAWEPALGPLAASGLRLTYVDSTGVLTSNPTRVARIGVTITGRTREPVYDRSGNLSYVVDSLVTQVALRNNPRF
jgi:prepilin-type N-terminal cleavage/methylation domain-containing protein